MRLTNTTQSHHRLTSITMGIHVLDRYYLGITAIITAGYQLLFFAVAFTFKFDKVTGKLHQLSCMLFEDSPTDARML